MRKEVTKTEGGNLRQQSWEVLETMGQRATDRVPGGMNTTAPGSISSRLLETIVAGNNHCFLFQLLRYMHFYAPLEKGGILFCNCRSVGMSVGMSVCRPSVVRWISFDPFIWSIPNLEQGLTSMSKWSLLIFTSHVQRSRSNHSLEPTVLSAQYLLTPSLDQYQTWCRGCLQWVDDPYWFSGHMFKGQGQTTLLSPVCCLLNIFWTLHLINTKLGAGVSPNK